MMLIYTLRRDSIQSRFHVNVNSLGAQFSEFMQSYASDKMRRLQLQSQPFSSINRNLYPDHSFSIFVVVCNWLILTYETQDKFRITEI